MPGSNLTSSMLSGPTTTANNLSNTVDNAVNNGSKLWGAADWSSINPYLGIASGAISAISGGINASQIKDASSLEDYYINSTKGMYSEVGNSLEDVLNQHQNFYLNDAPSTKDLLNYNAGQQVGNALSTGLSTGLSIGMAAPPLGGAIGAGVGLLASGIGAIRANRKAYDESKKLRNLRADAYDTESSLFQDNLQSTYRNLQNQARGNIIAYGGPLTMRYTGILSPFGNRFSDGGSIHINPENRGKFNATKKRTGKTTEELTHSKNPLTRKRAIFAQNAAKWHHAFGGELNTNGGDFSTGLMFIDEGGTHESNPYEGVPMGVDSNGKPNLVEEGEAIYNDYVFSNRLTVPKAIRNKYKLRGTKSLTFADAVKQLTKGATERPNDPISQETLHEIMSDLAQTQEGVREEAHEGNRFDTGGNMWTPTKINTYKGVPDYYGYDKPFWMNNDGTYTDKYNSFINNNYTKDMFRQHIKNQFDFYDNATEEQRKGNRYKAIQNFIDNNKDWYNNRANIANWNISDALYNQGKTLALSNPGFMHPEEIAQNALAKRANRYFLRGKDAKGNFTVTPMEVTPWKGKNDLGRTFAETYPQYRDAGKQERPIENGTIYTDYYYDTAPVEEKKKNVIDPQELKKSYEGIRYAPAIGLGMAALSDALGFTNKPDYSSSDAILNEINRANDYIPVGYKPIGDYLTYSPFDINYTANQIRQQGNTQLKNISNLSGGNRAAAMAQQALANYDTQVALGNAYRQAEESNLAQREKVAAFNRGTNQYNAEAALKTDMANQQAYANARDYNLKGVMAAAEMRQKARLASEAAKSANLSGLLSTLGDIGYENKGMNMIRYLYGTGALGPMDRKTAEGLGLIKPNKSSNKKNSKKITD